MRLWSLHPEYLDTRGLVALWREALLAQAVILGKTRGYTHHPQLARFNAAPNPAAAIATYLRGVHAEALRRGYAFDAKKISRRRMTGTLPVTRGQLNYEWRHLLNKLQQRAPHMLAQIKGARRVRPHPMFRVVRGPVESWEVVTPASATT